jgi:hypothetical protein
MCPGSYAVVVTCRRGGHELEQSIPSISHGLIPLTPLVRCVLS